jgi:hypothetical protein
MLQTNAQNHSCENRAAFRTATASRKIPECKDMTSEVDIFIRPTSKHNTHKDGFTVHSIRVDGDVVCLGAVSAGWNRLH